MRKQTPKRFFDEMCGLGWVDGRSVAYERAYAGNQYETMNRLAAELVSHEPEAIYPRWFVSRCW